MKSTQELICAVAPGCNYKVGIRIYPSVKALQKVFLVDGGGGEAEAFCSCDPDVPDDRIATLHFHIREMSPEIVAHEVFHAVAQMIGLLHLNLEDEDAQELAAYAMSHLVEKALHAATLYRRSNSSR
jgi:hypothetical protein